MIVDPRFRGHHLAERMARLRNEVAIEMGLAGVYCDCVTNHVGSQRAALQRGSVEIGLMIGAVSATTTMAGLPNPDGGRRSLLAMYNTCGPLLGPNISVPAHLSDLVAPIAAELGLEREPSTDVITPDEGRLAHRVALQAWADGTALLTVRPA